MNPIVMPQVGHNIPTATVTEWKKREGDRVEKGEVVLVIESDKSAFEVEAEESGVLLKILHEEGEEVEVFKPVAYIGEPGEKAEAMPGAHGSAVSSAPSSQKPAVPSPRRSLEMAAPPNAETRGVVSSPAARRLAREHGIDLGQVQGSGPGGRITAEDVMAVIAASGGAA
jgi:pyruvate dehydrogenase E2 component (dihydrolipoamide acetyltransferase)